MSKNSGQLIKQSKATCFSAYLGNIYWFKVKNRNTRKKGKYVQGKQKRTITTSGVFIPNFGHISYLFLVFLLLTCFKC